MGYPRYWTFLIIVTIIFAAMTTETTQYAWLSLAMLFGVILVIDYMFGDDKSFVYDPDYKGWKQKTQYEY
ncbi:hypothetical protein pb186bvf_017905 [Paramecium bursaria]